MLGNLDYSDKIQEVEQKAAAEAAAAKEAAKKKDQEEKAKQTGFFGKLTQSFNLVWKTLADNICQRRRKD